jgi:ABC-type Mn2+/Zn2+ transport system ATPase subunit
MSEKAISVENLSVSFGGFSVLSEVSFEINKGAVAIIIGPNGAGKTTLIKAILGLIQHSGTAYILGKTANKMNKKSRI